MIRLWFGVRAGGGTNATHCITMAPLRKPKLLLGCIMISIPPLLLPGCACFWTVLRFHSSLYLKLLPDCPNALDLLSNVKYPKGQPPPNSDKLDTTTSDSSIASRNSFIRYPLTAYTNASYNHSCTNPNPTTCLQRDSQ